MKLTLNREYAVRHLGVSALFVGLAGWFLYDAVFVYPYLPADGAHHTTVEFQYSFAALLATAAFCIAFRVWANRKRVVEWDDEKLWGPGAGDVETPFSEIVGVEDAVKVSAEDASLAGLEDSIRFVRESGIDAFAPAIGTAHGVYKGRPKINFDLVAQLREAVPAPVVIHGGTGLSEETFRRLIRNGGAKVNVSTAIKHAYLDTCRDYFKDAPAKPDPIGFDRALSQAIEQTARDHMVIFTKDRI